MANNQYIKKLEILACWHYLADKGYANRWILQHYLRPTYFIDERRLYDIIKTPVSESDFTIVFKRILPRMEEWYSNIPRRLIFAPNAMRESNQSSPNFITSAHPNHIPSLFD